MAEHGLRRQERSLEKIERLLAGAPRFEQAAFVEQHQRLVKIDQRRPDVVLLLHEQVAPLREELERGKPFAELAESNGAIGERLGSFVSHAEFGEALLRGARGFSRVFAQVQLEVDLGEVEMTEREMVRVAGGAARLARLAQ